MSDTTLPTDPEQELLAPPPELLSLTAGEEHLMIAAGEEEKLLMSGHADTIMADTPIADIAETSSESTISTATEEGILDTLGFLPPQQGQEPTPEAVPVTTEDLFADLPVSPVEKAMSQDIEPVSAVIGSGDEPQSDNSSFGNTGFLPPQEGQKLTIEESSPTLSSEAIIPSSLTEATHLDDHPSTPFYGQEHGVHVTPSSHVGIFVTIGVLALGIIGAGAWYFSGGPSLSATDVAYTISAEAPATYAESIEVKRDTHARDIDLQNRAMSEGDSGLCAAITDLSMGLECSESLQAIRLTLSGTLADCQVLTLTGVRDRCQSTIAQNTALSSMDKSLCTQITSEAQQLYCREEIDARVLTSLIETQTATSTNCASLEAKHREACLASIVRIDDNTILQDAVRTDDLEACQQLSTEDLKYICFDTILMKRALISGDKNNCDYLHDEGKKATCIGHTSAQDDNEVFKKAIIGKSLPLCKTISNLLLTSRCHDSVTLLLVRDTKDVTLCDTLTNTGTLAACQKLAPTAQ